MSLPMVRSLVEVEQAREGKTDDLVSVVLALKEIASVCDEEMWRAEGFI